MSGKPPSLQVYGAGRTGLAVARLARARGVPLAGIWNRSPLSADRAALAEGLEVAVGGPPPAEAAAIWLLAVADDAVGEVAEQLAEAAAAPGAPRPHAAAHCAGALTAEALAPLAGLGIPCGAWHPAMAFRGAPDDAEALAVAWVAVEGPEEARATLEDLAAALGLGSVPVAAAKKPRYHAALVLASNGRVALDAAARRLLDEAGIAPGVAGTLLAPLVERTEANLRESPLAALTGPVARGDARTVRVQVEALADRPNLMALYRAVGAVLLDLVPSADRTSGHAAVARLVGRSDLAE